METYIAFLRAVNVGGKGILSMKTLRETFEALGFTAVQTYINSGNVIFRTARADPEHLARKLQTGISRRTGVSASVLVLSRPRLKQLVDSIPTGWVDDAGARCYVFLLWKAVDRPSVLKQLPASPEIEQLEYVPGAVLWRIDRQHITRSKLTRIVGTPLYKQMTSRNSTTIRKLVALASGSGD